MKTQNSPAFGTLSPTVPDASGLYGAHRLAAADAAGQLPGALPRVTANPRGVEVDSKTLELAARLPADRRSARGRREIQMFADGVTDAQIGAAFFDPANYPALLAAMNRGAQELGAEIIRAAALSARGATPQRDGDLVDVFYRGSEEPIDLSWTLFFDMKDYRNTTESYFEVGDVSDAVTFKTYADGQRVELVGVSGSVQGYKFQNLGGGFQFDRNWEADNKLWAVADGIRAMNTGYGNGLALLMWQVLTAAGLPVTARVAGATTVEQDVRSINAAMTEIRQDLNTNEGYRTSNPVFGVAYNGLTAGMAERAAAVMAAQLGIANAQLGHIALNHTVQMVDSPNVPAGGFYVFLPKRRIKGAVRQDLMVYPWFDPLTGTDARVGWGRATGVRGTTRQGRFVPNA